MAMPYRTTSIVCPELIGRAAALASLEELLDHLASGRGRTVLIAGEAGIGKSRLVAELAARAGTRLVAAGCPPLTLHGQCFEHDRVLPYAPLLDLLRAYVTACPPDRVRDELGRLAPDLLPLLPELAVALPDTMPSPLADPEAHRRRLFFGLVQWVARLAAEQPLLLVIEDIHWSDDTSLDFLLTLARRIVALPVLLLLPYRDDETHPGLAHCLAGLDRERLAEEVNLSRLGRTETAAMLAALLGRRAGDDLVDAVHGLTDGNPFFVEEVLRSLAAGPRLAAVDPPASPTDLRLPRSVQDAVQGRLARLSPAARQLLESAAVAGRRFDLRVLEALTDHGEATLLTLLKEMLAAHLVVEESADLYSFRHALTRQAVYNGLLARERRALHGRIAEAIEQIHSGMLEPHLADLCHHYSAAERWEPALRYARQAGDQAQAMHAPRTAIGHYTRALEAAQQMSEPSLALRRARAQALEILGDFAAARADHEAALSEARAADDRRAEWQALSDLGFLWAARDYAHSRAYYEEALARARALDDPALLAHTLNRLGNWRVNNEEPWTGLRQHEEALALFERLGDEQGMTETLDLIALAQSEMGDLIASAATYAQVIARFRAVDDRRGLASAMALSLMCGPSYIGDACIVAHELRAVAARTADEAIRLAREIGWRAGEAYALCMLGVVLGSRGEYGQALAAAREGLAIAEEIEHQGWQCLARFTLGMIWLDLLDPAAARACLDPALAIAQALNSRIWVHFVAGLIAATAVAQGDAAHAETVLAAHTPAEEPPPPLTVALRSAWLARVGAALASNQPDRALALTDHLLATVPRVEEQGVGALPHLALLRAEALAALGRTADAETTLLAARAGATDLGQRSRLWRIEAALARFYSTQRRHADAEAAGVAARTMIDTLAATVPDPDLRSTFIKRAMERLPAARPVTALRAAKQMFGGLTARERDVAVLVAQGLTNKEIAAALSIGEMTIATHVSSILAKLELTTRTQIATWTLERGLGRQS
jgi:DNA-binding CsgD family transcriptional regulator/tetratricopeptide (TPR) repeat protein